MAFDEWLDGLTSRLSTYSLRDVHAILKGVIRQARARDTVMCNVVEPVGPQGQAAYWVARSQAAPKP